MKVSVSCSDSSLILDSSTTWTLAPDRISSEAIFTLIAKIRRYREDNVEKACIWMLLNSYLLCIISAGKKFDDRSCTVVEQ